MSGPVASNVGAPSQETFGMPPVASYREDAQ
ncbi:hypothetical protein J2S71_000133 [Olsenella profusa DSM 13989]|nr:hypothetical protein [Olsenella profusa DSM 13989]